MQTEVSEIGVEGDHGAEAGKYLTFLVADEYYGLGILKIQEIIGMMPVTRIPRSPKFVRGVINLRGRIIPVMDLRRKFDLDGQEDTERTCIIVVQIQQDGVRLTMGLLVDEVSEVVNVLENQLEPPPAFGTNVDTEFLLGMAKIGGKVVILLDVDRVLTGGEVEMVSEVAEQV